MMDQVIFHGGCLGCTQQETHIIDFCFDCQYFDAKWEKPDLSNQPDSSADLIRKEIKFRKKLSRLTS